MNRFFAAAVLIFVSITAVARDLEVSDLPDIRATTNFNYDFTRNLLRSEPREPADASAFVQNIALLSVAHDVQLVIRATGGAKVAAIKPGPLNTAAGSCSVAGDEGVCIVPLLEPLKVFAATVTLTAPDRDTGGRFGLSVEAMAAEQDANRGDNVAAAEMILVRQLHVVNADDSGAGSLRQTMIEANALCRLEPCRIGFEEPFSIVPESPLPAIAGIIDIDAGSRVEISGRKLSEGDGIVIGESCELHVLGLAIRDFPGTGIVVAGGSPQGNCYALSGSLGPAILVRDSVIERNLRGVVSTHPQGIAIQRNVISGNRRSAIFLDGDPTFTITENRISGNGASGIFIGHGTGNIFDNEISSNTDFGVARALFAGRVAMHRNLIFGNGHTAIDVGLDLETPNVGDDSNFAIPNRPQLLSAYYDAASGKTVIRGLLRSSAVPTIQTQYFVEFYVSDALTATGHAQAQVLLGGIGVLNAFEFKVDGDLTGQWIAATNTRSLYSPFAAGGGGVSAQSHGFFPASTSELSDPIKVTP